MSRIGNFTRLILTLAICDDHMTQTYIYTLPRRMAISYYFQLFFSIVYLCAAVRHLDLVVYGPASVCCPLIHPDGIDIKAKQVISFSFGVSAKLLGNNLG